MTRFARQLSGAMALIAALLSSACIHKESVVFRPLQSGVSPYSSVTIEVDHESRTIRAVPDPVIIWFESENDLSQILWTVRCIKGEGDDKDDVACPQDATVIIRPKEGCSKTLFGATAGAPDGEIRIGPSHNAIPSGIPNVEEARQLFRLKGDNDTFCDGSSRANEVPMDLSESVHDIGWVYEIEVRRPGYEPFIVDPMAWIETTVP